MTAPLLLRVALALVLVLAACAVVGVRAASLEANPVSVTASIRTLNKFNPARGGPVVREALAYVVPIPATAMPREVLATAAPSNASVNATRRNLETSGTDIGRLNEFFGESVETNVDTLKQWKIAEQRPIPWPSSYWPTYADGINYRWAGASVPSPAEKYATAFGLDVKKFTDAVSNNNGILSQSGNHACSTNADCQGLNDGSVCAIRRGETTGRCIPTWYGICHAWAPAAILEPEPRCAVTRGSTQFRPFDIKALLTQVYDGANVGIVFTGARFDGPDWPENKDSYGRYNDAARRDLGPGFFHIAIHNIMGKHKTGFIVDVTAGAEVWNQPVRGYEVLESKDLSRAEAASTYFGVNLYPFNNDASSLVYVHLRFSYMNEGSEDGPVIENGHADSHTATREYTYLLELNAQRQIIGGEWVGNSQTNHPDFLWFPTGRPDMSTVTEVGLSYKNVRDLLDESLKCGSDPVTCAPTDGPCGNAAQGLKCCVSGDSCQLWNSKEYRCRPSPQKCGVQQVGVDFYGDDIRTVYGILPEACCDECARTPSCKAYTFVSENWDGKSACYLKRGSGDRRALAGAVSAEVKDPLQGGGKDGGTSQQKDGGASQQKDGGTSQQKDGGTSQQKDGGASQQKDGGTSQQKDGGASQQKDGGASQQKDGGTSQQKDGGTTQQKDGCSTPLGGKCGNQNGHTCCPSGSYCQPWDRWYYQCLSLPTQCSQQYTDVDFYGNDIRTVYNISPSECCAECVRLSNCKAYTFVNENWDGRPTCYLKSSAKGQVTKTGAVSGIRN